MWFCFSVEATSGKKCDSENVTLWLTLNTRCGNFTMNSKHFSEVSSEVLICIHCIFFSRIACSSEFSVSAFILRLPSLVANFPVSFLVNFRYSVNGSNLRDFIYLTIIPKVT